MITEKDAGDDRGIDAMIAAPSFQVIVKKGMTRPSHGRVPRDAIPLCIAHNQIGSVLFVGAPIGFDRLVNPFDGSVVGFWVDQAC